MSPKVKRTLDCIAVAVVIAVPTVFIYRCDIATVRAMQEERAGKFESERYEAGWLDGSNAVYQAGEMRQISIEEALKVIVPALTNPPIQIIDTEFFIKP